MDIRVTIEDPRGAISAALIAELSAELAGLYPSSHSGDDSGAFKPEDVIVPRAAFVVAWDGGLALGCGALSPMNDPNIAEIKRMYVRSEVRGKGISRLVLSALEDFARECGYHTLMLETGTRQSEVIELYESSGYQLTDCYRIYVDAPLSVCYKKVF